MVSLVHVLQRKHVITDVTKPDRAATQARNEVRAGQPSATGMRLNQRNSLHHARPSPAVSTCVAATACLRCSDYVLALKRMRSPGRWSMRASGSLVPPASDPI